MKNSRPETTSAPFEFTGEFCGFVVTPAGKRRFVLRRSDGAELLLKARKKTRRRVAAWIEVGQEVTVRGVEEKDMLTGASLRYIATRVVAETSPAPRVPAEVAPIRVCAKKNCWQHGGRELWAALETALATHGLAGVIRLKAVKCLDRCKAAPNVDWNGCAFRRCATTDAETIVAHAGNAFQKSG